MESVALLRRKTAETAIDPIVMTLEECVFLVLIARVMSGWAHTVSNS